MMKVLIADDEAIVLEGLKYIIDWKELGFTICGEASNGEMALEKILELSPDLVLLDIRMPKLNGTDVIKQAKEQGYKGKFIIISGYSDFTYAQTAIKYGVEYYLTKPVDEDELSNCVTTIKKEIEKTRKEKFTYSQYYEKAKQTILADIITGSQSINALQYPDLSLDANVYKVIIYENYNQEDFHTSYSFADMLRVTNHGNDSFEHVLINNQDIILLKGEFALERFDNLLQHYEHNPQKGSPLDTLFLTHGRNVYRLEDIYRSYEDAESLLNRRFFCKPNQHVFGYQELPDESLLTYQISKEETAYYYKLLTDYLQSFNRQKISDALSELEGHLTCCTDDIKSIKYFLADLFLQIKHDIAYTYSNSNIPFATNSAILSLIEQKYYLYEILHYFEEQFEIIMKAIGNQSSDSVLNDILYYIEHNYNENLKLETLAPLFGYNSSYLGKFFSKKMGKNFNAYLDELRINHSKELLKNKDLKVYMISEMVGYKNVDYFHKKFKKYVGISPAEYRKAE
ncbi:two-component response regulator yesN [Lachnospiraceae bacterium KM106-2]|nr:two-component response regulator yesN [Lachnospiraceae bacterium KM106-2]